jgi:HEAT repeat protein
MVRLAARAGLTLTLWLPFAGSLPAAPPPAQSTNTEPKVNEVGGKTLKQWIADLKHADPSVREEAIRAIPYFGAAASEAVPALIEHINDPDASPRSKAILTLGMIKIEDKDRDKVVRALGDRLDGRESQGPIRYDIALVLMSFGKDSHGALSGLLFGAADTSCWEIRRICLAALVEAGQTDKGPDPRVTRALVVAVRDDEPAAAVRLQGVQGLAQMGKSADPDLLAHEVMVVRNRMKDRDKTVVIWAHLSMMALDKIDDADIEFLTRSAQPDELERVRVAAIGALVEVGTKEKKVVPTLIDFLSEKQSPNIVAAACQALGAVGDPGQKAESALIAVAKDDKLDENVRFQAIYGLGMIAAKDKAVIAALVDLLSTDKDPNVVMTVCHAFGAMDEPGGAVEQALTNLVHNMDVPKSVRDYAEKILESIGKNKRK